MTDRLTPERRSWLMSQVRRRDTSPEMTVRRLLFKEGYRFRIHRRDLPGNPDIVLPRFRTVIFVHGCFWHRHPGCAKATTPKTRAHFWQTKFEQNVARDERNKDALERLGWTVITVWECELQGLEQLRANLTAALGKQ